MSDVQQSFASHARYMPLWHFVAFPILLINAVVALIALVRVPTGARFWLFLVSVALAATVFTARAMSLILQNRLIRLEERVRLARILPPELQEAGAALRTDDLIGLRFASDEEVPGLVRRIASGELASRQAIKAEVKSWRADTLRV